MQLDLFSTPPVSHPMARAEDPESSHLAAKKAERFAKAHREQAVDWVFRFPRRTTKQLAELEERYGVGDKLGNQELSRRLPEAEREGLIRSEPGTGKLKAKIWMPA